jgi:hypothetical protein
MSGISGSRLVSKESLEFYVDGSNQKSLKDGDSIWNDLSGNGYNVPFTGALYDSDGGGSLSFDGLGGKGELNGDFFSVVGTINYTVSMWVNLNSSTDGNDVRFFWHGNYGNIFYKSNNDNLIFYINTTTNAKSAIGPSGFNLYNQWVHLVGTYDGSNVIGYLNTEPFDTEPHSGTFKNAAGDPARIRLGSNGSSFLSEIKIGNCMIYTKTLSQQEIKIIYNSQKTKYGIL